MRTDGYPHFRQPFERYNAVQSAVVPFCDKDCNLVVASPPSTGKTAIAECCFGWHASEGEQSAYVCPYRSLAKEQFDKWTGNPQLGGVFLKTGEGEAGEGLVGIYTCESFLIRCYEGGLEGLGCVVFDEAHLLGDSDRGPALEAAIMRVSESSPARLVLLSGTVGNPKAIAKWLKVISGKTTRCFVGREENDKVQVNFERMDGVSCKVRRASEIAKSSGSRKVIVFVQSKKVGAMVSKELKRNRVVSAFHNASLPAKRREAIESAFRDGSRLNVVVATSTLSAGVNL